MKYLVWETCCGELFNRVALCNDINTAEKFIESCAFATDNSQHIEYPVIAIVNSDTKFFNYEIKENFQRFRRYTHNL